jgi:hypothetical protein
MGMAEFDWLRRMASPGGELTRTSPNVRRVRSHLPAVYLDSQRAVQKRLTKASFHSHLLYSKPRP